MEGSDILCRAKTDLKYQPHAGLQMHNIYMIPAVLFGPEAGCRYRPIGDFPESDNYTYLAGICYKKIGKNDQAKNQFQKIIQNSDTGSRVKDAELELVLLKNSE